MDQTFYQEQIEKMLSNTKYYNKSDNNPHKEIMKKYRSLLKKHEIELTKKEFDYLNNFECKTSFFMDCQKSIRVM